MAAPQGRLAPHVRAWRKRRYLTQQALAMRAGIKPLTVRRAEHGGALSDRTIWALATALGVTPDQLCYEEPDGVAV